VIVSGLVVIPPARRLFIKKRKPSGARGTPTTLLPGASTLGACQNNRRNRFGCGFRYRDFPGISRKTSSGPKALISLGLWAHYSKVPRKTSYEAISLNLLRIEDDFKDPPARRDRPCVLMGSTAEEME
jgi:hypothetical protein